MKYELKRSNHMEKEKIRWEKEAHVQHEADAKLEHTTTQSLLGKKSKAYDIINHQYHQDIGGLQLKREDDIAREKVYKRGHLLFLKNNTFNPITGNDIKADNFYKK
jgi:hypothetical protein